MIVFPQGKYRVRTSRIEIGESSKKGTPQIVVWFHPLCRIGEENEFPCEDGEGVMYLYLTEKTIDRSAKDIAVIGYRGPMEHLYPDNPNYSPQDGLEFEAECKHDTQWNKEVWSVFGSGGAMNRPLSPTKAALLSSQFSQRFSEGLREAVRNDEYSQPVGELTEKEISAAGNDIPF